MVVFILLGATVFSLVFQGVNGGRWIEHLLSSLPGGQTGFLIFTMVFIFFIAFFLDFFEICFIVIPMLLPVAQALDINLVWFGLLICVNIQTSFMHPPFGFALFYLRGIAPKEVKSSDIYWGAVPWIGLQLVLVAILIAWPESVTYWIGEPRGARPGIGRQGARGTDRSRHRRRHARLRPAAGARPAMTGAEQQPILEETPTMKRRNFLKVAAGGGAAAATLAAPAIAQTQPKLQWRLTSGFPRSLDTIFGAAEVFAEHVKAMTDGNFEIQVFPAGEIVPTPQAAEAVGTGTVEMAPHLLLLLLRQGPDLRHRHRGSLRPQRAADELLALPGRRQRPAQRLLRQAQPLRHARRQHRRADGRLVAQRDQHPRRHAGRQDAHRRPRRPVVEKLGVVPQQIPGGDIYPALERGTIDAAEWVGPYDDQKLGFYKVAPYYYYPGFWEGGPAIHFFINLEKWKELPPDYQAILTNAAAYANTDMQAKYDARNPAALRELDRRRRQAQAFPTDVIDAAYNAANEVYDEISAENADFKTIIDSVKAFRNEGYLWWQVAEYTYDTFMIRNRTKG